MVVQVAGGFDPGLARPVAVVTWSFERVYGDQFAFVWRNARRLGVSQAHLDDVVQEVFVVVHRRLADVADRSELRGWVLSILFGVVANHRRALRRRAGDDPDADPEAIAAPLDAGPEEHAARSEAARVVTALLDALDEDKRQVFVLADLEQLPVPEIAEAMGINVNTAYARLRAARRDFSVATARFRTRDGWRIR